MATTYFNMELPWYSFSTIPASGSKTISISNSAKALVNIVGVSNAVKALYIISTNSNGTMAYSAVYESSAISASIPSGTTGQITFSNSNASYNPNIYVMCFSGTASPVN